VRNSRDGVRGIFPCLASVVHRPPYSWKNAVSYFEKCGQVRLGIWLKF